MSTEEKVILGYPDYTITIDGVVTSYRRRKAKVLKHVKDDNGYPVVCLSYEPQKHRTLKIHRLVMTHFNPHPNQDDLFVDHINGDVSDFRIENLRWCTHKENVSYYIDLTGGLKGENVPNSTHSDSEIIEIMNFLYEQRTHNWYYIKETCERYKIHRNTVKDVMQGRSWTHLKMSRKDLGLK